MHLCSRCSYYSARIIYDIKAKCACVVCSHCGYIGVIKDD